MENWSGIPPDSGSVRYFETESSIELFVPFSDCMFVRPVLLSLDVDGSESY
jgi:hypothetical protein